MGPLVERLIGLHEPQAWDAALEGLPHGFHHRWAWCHATSLQTGWPVWLYVADRGPDRIACPFAERHVLGALDLVTPRGFSGFAARGDWTGFSSHWHAFAADRGAVCGYLAQHPAFGGPELEGPAGGSAALHFVDLHGGGDAAIGRARKGRRRELRAWSAAGGRYVLDAERNADFARREHAAFMDRAGAGSAARWDRTALDALLAAPDTLLVGAAGAHGDEPEAVLLLGATPWGGEGLFQVATPAGRRHGVALLGWALRALADRGVPWFNLGGGVRDGDSLAAAKREWNPRVLRLRRLRQVYDPRRYAELCAAAGVTPEAGTDGWFPAYHRHPA